MSKSLLDVVFASDKRKNALLLLQDGPKETEKILGFLKTTRKALLPQMKILEEHHLVFNYEDTYELTTIGKLLVSKMQSSLKIVELLDSDIDYWGSHRLNFIPEHLLKKISQLGKCTVVNPNVQNSFELNKKIVETSYLSRSLFVIAAFYHPDYFSLCFGLTQKSIDVYTIISLEILDKLRTEHNERLIELLKMKHFHLFVYPQKMEFQGIAFNGHYVLIRLLKNDGNYDSSPVLCSKQSAFEWSKELFEYYLKDSFPVTKDNLNVQDFSV
ncbi:winged helix-turn-helix domain-containing protein [Methanolobus sp. ZRKC2]|uniref:helix-turn-helix transcriptional regulator n=1 Tax=Methanolobus sp. ZRKC2 TaxID=3125783 RepID=UPI00324D707D